MLCITTYKTPLRLAGVALLSALALVSLPQTGRAQTAGGFEIGFEGEYYKYSEPNLDHMAGGLAGLDADYVLKVPSVSDEMFLKLDGNFDFGTPNYTSNGTGKANGVWNYKGDFRTLLGSDFYPDMGLVLSPYFGLGYRVLFEDGKGQRSSTGFSLYDRVSQYFYLPLGLTVSVPVASNWTLKPNFEGDVLLGGYQTTYLSQVPGAGPDFENHQHRGYGLRGGLSVETNTSIGRLSFGPYVRYWEMHTSTMHVVSTFTYQGNVYDYGYVEPINHTLELGAAVKLAF